MDFSAIPLPRFAGCDDWNHMRRITGLAIEEPQELVFLSVEPTTHRPGHRVVAFWRDAGLWHLLMESIFEDQEPDSEFGPVEPFILSRDEEETYRDFMGEKLRLLTADLPMATTMNRPDFVADWMIALAPLFEEILKERGVHPLFLIECTSGDRYETFTHPVAAYRDPQLARSHALAATALQETEDDGEDAYSERSFYHVRLVLMRDALPDALATKL